MSVDGWHRVEPVDVPGEGRVRSVVVGGRTVALARCGVRLGALDNRCPHQGGPLGEGSIENGWLRCPWHGYAERDAAGLVQRYLARLDGVPAGGGSMRVADGIAQLTGAGTAPAFRRRGIQSAQLSARLADATAAGCDLAVITVQPGSKSQQNAQRRGFDLLYTRAVLAREDSSRRLASDGEPASAV
ncbi:GNAT family N-acetyltransferase [Actinoplanes subtropicus]|uniref:GNAT family N-acetyltransferase n=1 Tax=Actinoplanes subtropicus TaxID=543632 RepID=UPI000A033FE7|nr:GNAT family N-acetyltransferase [Actinoplanes subtropicus]